MESSLPYSSEVNIKAAAVDYSPQQITELYYRHINTVYRLCYSLMGNQADAEDAAQSVFLKLINSKKSFADVEHEKAWLITAAQNQCRDLHRQWWRRRTQEIDPDTESPDKDLKESDVMEKLLRLPPNYRVVLYLYYYEGYKAAEIAAMLRVNHNTVKARLCAARRRLKLEIGEEINE